MLIERDEEKNKINAIKHGISFQTARLVFADENLVMIPDEEYSVYEERYKVIGKIGRKKIILVVCTDRTNAIRIIFARQANAYERGIYFDKSQRKYIKANNPQRKKLPKLML